MNRAHHNEIGHWEFKLSSTSDIQLAWDKLLSYKELSAISEMNRALLRTMISELGTNIVKYAKRGSLRISLKKGSQGLDCDIWAEDSGPGIPNLDMAMQDHFSSSGTLGMGLPGVKRMSDQFWIRSDERGTLVFARKQLNRTGGVIEQRTAGDCSPFSTAPALRLESNALSGYQIFSGNRGYLGNALNGDLSSVIESGDTITIALIDGSGHGANAHLAAQRAAECLDTNRALPLAEVMTKLDAALCGTAGAAIAILKINKASFTAQFCGIGNVRTSRVKGANWRGISRDGVLGSRLPRLKIYELELARGDVFFMCTDGFPDYESRKYVTQNTHREPSALMDGLFKEHGKLYDDNGAVLIMVPK